MVGKVLTQGRHVRILKAKCSIATEQMQRFLLSRSKVKCVHILFLIQRPLQKEHTNIRTYIVYVKYDSYASIVSQVIGSLRFLQKIGQMSWSRSQGQIFCYVGKVLTQGRQMRSLNYICSIAHEFKTLRIKVNDSMSLGCKCWFQLKFLFKLNKT